MKTNRLQPQIMSLLISCFAMKPQKIRGILLTLTTINELSRDILVLVGFMYLETLKKLLYD